MKNKPRISRWKFALFAITPTVVLILAVELVLRVIGFHFNPHDLYRPILVSANDGYLRTSDAYIDNDRFVPSTFCVPQKLPQSKAPGTIRLALLGGSSVYLLGSADVLAEIIREKTGKPVEIMNFGILGCGSNRVVASARRAIKFDADLLIVYCGHNEFTSFSDGATYSTVPFGMRPIVQHSRMVQLAWAIADRTASRSEAEMHPGTKNFFAGQRTFSHEEKSKRYQQFSKNLRKLSDLCREHQRSLVLCTVAYNVELPPYLSESDYTLDDVKDVSTEAVLSMMNANPDDLLAAHQYGLRLYSSGKKDPGVQLIERAFIESPRPDRANQTINKIIREVAKEQHISLIDTHEVIRRAADDGLPGDELFRDNCHLNEKGNWLLQQAIGYYIGESITQP